MFERFTDRDRRVIVDAQNEARSLGHDYIGPEHILLGLLHEGDGVGAKALEAMQISTDTVRARIEEITGRSRRPCLHGGSTPLAPPAGRPALARRFA